MKINHNKTIFDENDKEIFIGIDPSLSGTGLVIINSSKILHIKLIETSPKEKLIEKRFIFIMNSIFESLGLYEGKGYIIKSIYIEGLSFGSKGQGTTDLAALHHMIRTQLFIHGIQCEVVAPLELKKWAIGISSAPKNVMLKEVYKRWGKDWDADFYEDNVNDGFAIAQYSKFLYLNPEQKEARDLKKKKALELKKKKRKNKAKK